MGIFEEILAVMGYIFWQKKSDDSQDKDEDANNEN